MKNEQNRGQNNNQKQNGQNQNNNQSPTRSRARTPTSAERRHLTDGAAVYLPSCFLSGSENYS